MPTSGASAAPVETLVRIGPGRADGSSRACAEQATKLLQIITFVPTLGST
jgi:hypothetical protein